MSTLGAGARSLRAPVMPSISGRPCTGSKIPGWFTVDDEPAYLREYEQLTFARLLLATRRGDDALGLLQRILAGAETSHRDGSAIEALALLALAHDATGDPSRALPALEEALTRAAAERFVRIFLDAGAPMKEAIAAVPYTPSVKMGMQFKRRFWEEDEAIYGGISFTDLPIRQLGYPSTGYHSAKGILLAYPGGTYGYEFASLSPAERVRRAPQDPDGLRLLQTLREMRSGSVD